MTTYPTIDSARTAACHTGALITYVEPLSPADDAGFTPGCVITTVEGEPLRDIIDWRWYGSDEKLTVGYIDLDGDTGEVTLEREEGQSWGIAFEGVVFDGVRQCRNACTFCFMHQLPRGMRDSLYVRDDDYRLSFLSGTFVTLTNMTPEEEQRVVDMHLSPLRMSLHAIDPAVRTRLIGRHAQDGIDSLERLLAQGIEFHVQIVLLPGENDGEVLDQTLEWAYRHPGILDVCIVPLGYTSHQMRFTCSFNDAQAARNVLKQLDPFQQRAQRERGHAWVFAADEFYRNAYQERVLEHLPDAAFYGDFAMFEDGVGIIRTFVDDWKAALERGELKDCACALATTDTTVLYVIGLAMEPHFPQLVNASPLAGRVCPLPVRNEYFGGNVDVTGLLCGCDIVRAVADELGHVEPEERTRRLVAIPSVVFNDVGLTLDGFAVQDLETATGARIAVVSCNASEFLEELTCRLTAQE
ncbi:MAG: DUF512 domain-containing protein [Eggerthellaceae bacterium]|nr:DUF512 domain-containing protein [Eggerthellaceae bacterium]